ncbi:MAG: phosphate regulon transcriptional regulator PhoB [Candidatus Marinimicrobia bacterium]|nr:phosphate regulon transcriptional regulator PhoB [Candidatus Neomarinimicrobiota bacterium]
MITPTILIIEDESAVREMLRFTLQQQDLNVQEAVETIAAEQIIAQTPPDLILLDWMLPGRSGVEFARQLKSTAKTASIPIIMLTARGEEDDKVQGLESGADDYITKPFSTRELIARIRAILRRNASSGPAEKIRIKGLSLDPATHRVQADKKSVALGPTEFRLLHFFMTHTERVYSRTQLLDQVWGTNVYVEERTVDVHIRRLRKALEPSGHDRLLQTVRGAGYRFSAEN